MKYQKRCWLAALRVGLDLTQKELADELGIPQPTYASYETGRRTPSYEHAKRIADRLGFDPIKLWAKDAS